MIAADVLARILPPCIERIDFRAVLGRPKTGRFGPFHGERCGEDRVRWHCSLRCVTSTSPISVWGRQLPGPVCPSRPRSTD